MSESKVSYGLHYHCKRGLHLIVPHGDDAHYRARPGIGLKKSELADLDGFFGLNPGSTRFAAFGPHSNEGTLTFGSVSAV